MNTGDTPMEPPPQPSLPDPARIIQEALGPGGAAGDDMLEAGRTYPLPLPAEIAPWYCYTKDGGHSLYVVVKACWEDVRESGGERLEDAMVPAPVKAVLRAGYTWLEGLPLVDLEYDPELGLLTEADDDEW